MANETYALADVEALAKRTGADYIGAAHEQAEALIEDASLMLLGSGFDPSAAEPWRLELAKAVVCSMVARYLDAVGDESAPGASVAQESMTAGPYTLSASYANAGESMYVTARELRMLGLRGSGSGRFIAPELGGAR